ncbi:carbonic anhydrase [Marilutibacter alkalisoli]|uniref:Carbonic anhydrase n=1 Tax=Marilutibacter alkalisoli TaxID=2591633 RepID=A0A514BSZ7_9GAMM|nr:carbonic anhydrase family protein [Lysobacter alkalisoli]QDH70435.1 carbonic anhydrase family protein [Lysobacter alkalisoli]
MKTRSLLASLFVASLALPTAAQEGGHPHHWGYAGEVGPEHWAEFESDFGTCGVGRNQSPIDLDNFIEAELPRIAFDYKPGGHEVVNNGHAIQVNYNPGSKITVDGTDFALKQFHFHSPSENTIKGKSFPMEAHFVHADAKGNLAVVALMFEQGHSNKPLEKVWPQVPQVENGKEALRPEVSAADLLPANRDYYRYNGSLTTPPCSEGVRWFVLKHTVEATADQLTMVGKAVGHANNRPVQPTGARAILE